MEIRKAEISDLEEILEIYRSARVFMKESGNSSQWGEDKPDRETLVTDIEKGNLYKGQDRGKIAFVFAFIKGKDPTYAVIKDGSWLNDLPYGTIHRVAKCKEEKGALLLIRDFCLSLTDNIRIDTHENNLPMRKKLKELGFKKCGIIFLEDGSERIAYQLVKEE